MKKQFLQFILIGLLVFAGRTAVAAANSPAGMTLSPQAVSQRMAAARVPFIENQGQIADPDVRFYAQTFAGTLFVTQENQLVYALPLHQQDKKAARWVFRESFPGRRPGSPRSEMQSPVQIRYFKGNNWKSHQSQLRAFQSISLGELFPGIHVSLKAAGNNVEKLFHVSPGARAEAIKVKIEGVQSLAVDAQGQLVLKTARGDIHFTTPVAYQVIDGRRKAVAAAYALDHGHYGFKLGEYDKSHELVIDPLVASTFIGGANPSPPGNYDDDIIHGMVVTDSAVYVAGATQSPDFPIVLGYDDTLGSAYPDGFVTQLSPDLSTIIASTYIGTQYFDQVLDLAVNNDGTVVAVGQAGYGFPVTAGAYTWNGSTPTGGGFVTIFSSDLSALVASAVVTPSSYPLRVALGNSGIYFGGRTNNPDFPITTGAYQSTCCPAGGFGIREYDNFAGRISADLSTLEALTYLDGDSISGMAVAPDGTVFITDGFDYAITGYVARFDAGLTSRLAYLSYYPGSTSGSSRTYFNDVAVDGNSVVVVGQTYMSDLPATAGAYDTSCGTDGLCDGQGSLLVPVPDAFVAKYSLDLQQTLALTYLGGSGGESARSVALDAAGDIYVTGETTSPDFPTTGNGAFTSYHATEADGFVVMLAPDLSQLWYGSYIGGSGEDRPNAIGLDSTGLAYIAGYTRSSDFPTTANAFDRTYNGGTSDAFITVFDATGSGSGGGGGGGGTPPANAAPSADAGSDQAVHSRDTVYLDGRGSSDPDGQIVAFQWTQVSGTNVSIKNADSALAAFRAPRVRRGSITLVFQLQVTDDQGATDTDQVTVTVTR